MMNSNVAIVGPGKPKDHRGISNTVDGTWVFRVAGRAASDVSYSSVSFFFYVKMALRKLATKVVQISIIIFSLCLYAYKSSQKVTNCLFLYSE